MSRPSRKEIEQENDYLQERQKNFILAAGYVSEEFRKIPGIQKIVLFGSCARPLWEEIPRFREYRRAGIELWHEVKDVDLAVWMDDLGQLKPLQKARSRAVNRLFQEKKIGVAHHQVEVFIMEPETDRYLGRLCEFGGCPKGKEKCLEPGCGAVPFLRLHRDFSFRPEALNPEKSQLLFDCKIQKEWAIKETG